MLAGVGFGQGPVSVAPLLMARAGAVLATGGKLIEPYLVQALRLSAGETAVGGREAVWRSRVSPPACEQAIPSSIALQLNRRLRDVFESPKGTAAGLGKLWFKDGEWQVAKTSPGKGWERVPLAGKTGTAWRTARAGFDDSWMVALGPSGERPRRHLRPRGRGGDWRCGCGTDRGRTAEGRSRDAAG